MTSFRIDIDSVQQALSQFSHIRENIGARVNQQRRDTDDVVNRLNAERNSWERRTADWVGELFSDTSANDVRGNKTQVEGLRNDASQQITALNDTHEGHPNAAIHDAANGLINSFDQAASCLDAAASVIGHSHFGDDISHPEHVHALFDEATQRLQAAEQRVASFHDFLQKLSNDEKGLLTQVEQAMGHNFGVVGTIAVLLPVGSVLSANAQHPDAIVVQTKGLCSTTLTATVSPGLAAGVMALQLEKLLSLGYSATGSYGYNQLDENALKQNGSPIPFTLIHPLYNSGPWNKNDVQCVAFVYFSLAAAGLPLPGIDGKPGSAPGDASGWWNSTFDSSFGKVGYAKIANSTSSPGWPPQQGDIVVMSGHVAMVTGIQYDKNHHMTGIVIAQANADKPTDTFKFDANTGVILPSKSLSGQTVQGFYRYTAGAKP